MDALGIRALLLASLTLCCFSQALCGREIYIPNPGPGNDIKPAIDKAMRSAASGDTIVIPPGEFLFEDQIRRSRMSKSIHIRGYGKNRTKLYRTRSEEGLRMFRLSGQKDAANIIRFSGIMFEGPEPSMEKGDGKSEDDDYCLSFWDNNFIVTGCRFKHFGHAAIGVRHPDEGAGVCLIYRNEFVDNYRFTTRREVGHTTGYGVIVAGADKNWLEDAKPGGEAFIFIEDNYFNGVHSCAIAGGGGGLYVFRHNLVRANIRGSPVDAHGGGKYFNTLSTRFYEVYNNVITVFKPRHARDAVGPRGGEGVIWNNRIEGCQRTVELTIEISGKYPVLTQIGYASAKRFGPEHSGTDPENEGDGDIFIWDNVPNTVAITARARQSAALKLGRDYHVGIPRPNYTPYAYPHPRRNIQQEIEYYLTTAPTMDRDGDGLSETDEFCRETDPAKPDTDGDGVPDGMEVHAGTDPLNPADGRRREGTTESVWELLAKKRKQMAQKEKTVETPGLDEARKLASQGDYAAAAKRLEQEIPAAAETDELKSLAAGFMAVKEMRSWIVDGTAQGRKESAAVNLLGMRVRGKVAAADADGLTVAVMGSESRVSWSELSPASFLSLAKKYARDGTETPQERLDALDLFVRACGLKSEP